MWIVIWCSYGTWKTTHGFPTQEAAQRHIDGVLCPPDGSRDYNKRASTRWIELPPEDS